MNDFQKPDIETEEDVKYMVNEFYSRVNADDLLAPIFNNVAQIDWEHHLPKMYAFWNFMILGIQGYKGQPFPMHVGLPIAHTHFARWLQLFMKNIDQNFYGAHAELAKRKAEGIALTFQSKLGIRIDN